MSSTVFFCFWYIYTMEYYTAERKKELLPFVTVWMDLESIMLCETSQVIKKIPYNLIYKGNLINKTSKQVKYKQRH